MPKNNKVHVFLLFKIFLDGFKFLQMMPQKIMFISNSGNLQNNGTDKQRGSIYQIGFQITFAFGFTLIQEVTAPKVTTHKSLLCDMRFLPLLLVKKLVISCKVHVPLKKKNEN